MVQRRGVCWPRSQRMAFARHGHGAAGGSPGRCHTAARSCPTPVSAATASMATAMRTPTTACRKLEGQHPEYLVTALHGYRDGDRAHLTMHSQASELSDQDIADIAGLLRRQASHLDRQGQGATCPRRRRCAPRATGGRGGLAPLYPSLAGQHEDYLGAPSRSTPGRAQEPDHEGVRRASEAGGDRRDRALLQRAAAGAENRAASLHAPWAQ